MVAARTDDSLKQVVAETDLSSLRAMRLLGYEASQVTQGISGEKCSRVEDLVELTVYLLRGLVLQQGVHYDLTEKRRLFELWLSLVREWL